MVAASLEPCLAMAEQRSKQTKKGIFNRCTPDIQARLTDFYFIRATVVKAWKPDRSSSAPQSSDFQTL